MHIQAQNWTCTLQNIHECYCLHMTKKCSQISVMYIPWFSCLVNTVLVLAPEDANGGFSSSLTFQDSIISMSCCLIAVLNLELWGS